MKRFAIYYAPQPGTLLAEAAASWLGRDHLGLDKKQITPDRLDTRRFFELTRTPCHYGFHGTLKPPFRLAEDKTETDLLHEIREFCSRKRPFLIPTLEVARIGSFLCLRPTEKAAGEITELAGELVEKFDQFRAPMDSTELLRRRKKGLTARQNALLERWGYPYVFKEFRFHLTLSSNVEDEAERDLIEQEARRHFPVRLLTEVAVEGLSIFIEEDGNTLKQQCFCPFTG